MGLGILEDRVMEHVPGTTRYFDDPERPQFAHDGSAGLKCDNSGPLPIILVPQPSDDPNDPLNWPLWRRDLICFVLSLTAIFATALGPIFAPTTLKMSIWFQHPLADIPQLTGYFLLGVGVAGIFFVPSSRIWGKRHAFIVGTCILIASGFWAAAAGHSFKSMVWARIIQGVGCAPFEALVNAAIGDLYFVHQRGKRMAFTNLAVFGGAFFAPIPVGKICDTIGWEWTFYLDAIFCTACLPAIFFLCPETAFRRDSTLNLDLLASSEGTTASHDKPTKESHEMSSNDEKVGASVAVPTVLGASSAAEADTGANADTDATAVVSAANKSPSTDTVPAKVPYRRTLALFNGRKSDENFLKLLLRPFPLFFQPAFLWASMTQGTLIGWTVLIGAIIGEFYFGGPMWWNPEQIGYGYAGAFVGAFFGFIISGLLADWSATQLTRLNKGIYEPEFRMVLVIPEFIFGAIGLFGFGITVDGLAQSKYHWSVPLVFFGFEVCAMVIGAVASSLYIVDAYRDLSIEGFTCLLIFKNFFSFGLTFEAFKWLTVNHTQAKPLFNILGGVQIAVCALAIPMYMFGKRNRSFFHRHDVLKLLWLR